VEELRHTTKNISFADLRLFVPLGNVQSQIRKAVGAFNAKLGSISEQQYRGLLICAAF
jgi:hypothetical protein